MRRYIAATVVASAFVVTPVLSDEHPAHWQEVENMIQKIHEQIDPAVEAGDAQQIHEFVDQLEAAFRNAVEMEQQHKDEDMHRRHEEDEARHRRHQAIDDQTHEKHEVHRAEAAGSPRGGG